VAEAALGQRQAVRIFGTDYDTPDGTAIRDYIHVTDLATAHVAALDYLSSGGITTAVNLGTGSGTSVRQIIEAIAEAAGRRPLVIEAERRAGDPQELVADPSLAGELLGWRAARSDITTIAADTVRWYREIAPLIDVA
jgi:UDP-glucose 4-epimerase